MTDRSADDWNAEERARLDALPRDRQPPPSLKERVAADLRGRGKLGPSTRSTSPHRQALPWAGRVAAAVALFVAGAWFGRASGGGEVPEVVLVTGPLLAPAERVQRMGSWYIESVAELALGIDSLPAASASQGREAALNTLRGAAEHVARIPGHDARIQRVLLDLRSEGSE